MSGWMRCFFALATLLLGLAALAAAPVKPFTSELDTDLYDCTLTLKPSGKFAAKSVIQVELDRKGEDGTVLTFSKKAITLGVISNGKSLPAGQVALPAQPGFPYVIVIQRRGEKLNLLCNDVFIFRKAVPRTPGGKDGVVTVGRGWADPQIAVQRMEPVTFADNFMRTADEPGAWTAQRGDWGLQSAWDHDP